MDFDTTDGNVPFISGSILLFISLREKNPPKNIKAFHHETTPGLLWTSQSDAVHLTT